MEKEFLEAFYKVAGLTIKMNSFGRTIVQAQPYRCEEIAETDVLIETKWEEIPEKYAVLSAEDYEYLCTGAIFYRNLLNYDGMMLHSSAVVVDGKAYLFSAPCGTGKSTHTNLWLKQFGERAYVLNDDKPALRLQGDTWYAYGTPWSGKHDISVNTGVPVAGIAMIEQSETNEIVPWKGKDAIFSVYSQVNRPMGVEYRVKLMELLDKIFEKVPIWKLRCNMEPEAALISYAAMSGNVEKE